MVMKLVDVMPNLSSGSFSVAVLILLYVVHSFGQVSPVKEVF